MTDILNESMADKIVIRNLRKELKKRGYMGKILVDPETGDIYNATQSELLSHDDLEKNLEESKDVIDKIERARRYSDSIKSQTDTTPAAVTDQPQVDPQAGVVLTPPENNVVAPAPVLQ
jgi:hypothetical protein